MREIKFRAWNTDDQEMYFVNSVNLVMGTCEVDGDQLALMWMDEVRDEQECILMQFAGLKDTKGRDIYEGDIVRFEAHRDGKEYYSATEPVAFDLGQFHIYGTALRDYQNIKVIGNIYQNADLLK